MISANDMNAVRARAFGAPDVLTTQRQPIPEVGENEILIKVAAAGMNAADLSQRRGTYGGASAAIPSILGLEVSGHVVTKGRNVTMWNEGDAVCALLNGGGYAEFAVAHESLCLPVPKGIGLYEAAGLPEAVATVWLNVFDLGRLMPGETLLVHGGAGGIGTMAIQLATALGSRVVVTAGSDTKCAACIHLGAVKAINYKEADFLEVLQQEKIGINVVLEMIGGDYLGKDLDCLSAGGRISIIGLRKGGQVNFDFSKLQAKGVAVTGSRLMPKSIAEKTRLFESIRKVVWPLIEQGQMTPVISETFPLAEAARAHTAMEAGTHVGKLLLTVS
ncbi:MULTISPECIES: NAD(P)H-quinone oxidoreductase [unclassified Beijerinckia]|uniref:NAD(P)H-quinone oxidoreductase n=1 Tax=unclassified Beijerinckia TaxID=2638183 RepID=UPI00089C1C78|nr:MULTISPECIES: NAD(P)H-quinone oxidoreductase [unclassified Beijerinckia]MDH7797054.1 NADPH2:quinone reductase [Beijerinckia sp. GAS462]SEC70357.1 putative NAD(P)H quinone oxidoreductase, PIG3 family [Beijerinckia sp. 28-YEA-48]